MRIISKLHIILLNMYNPFKLVINKIIHHKQKLPRSIFAACYKALKYLKNTKVFIYNDQVAWYQVVPLKFINCPHGSTHS